MSKMGLYYLLDGSNYSIDMSLVGPIWSAKSKMLADNQIKT